MRELRDDFITDAFRSVQATVYVGCASANDIDFGLAVAVLVDATIVRTVLVPSTMQ